MRVIAGRLGGRRLDAPKGRGTRPTSDRVKEALFSILGDVASTQVLDLYAGTGALGIEALSRGALRAVFVESAPAPLLSLQKNVQTLNLGDLSTVVAARVERATGRIAALGPFDLVFVDPPYAIAEEALNAVGELVSRSIVARHATIVLEHDDHDSPIFQGLSAIDRRSYGDTALSFFKLPEPAS